MDIREIEILFKDPSIHKFAVSLCRDNSLAEDLVMDVVTRLIEKAEKLPDDLNLKAYAITAIKNRFVDNHRRTRKEDTEATTEGGSLFDQLIDEAASSAIEAPIELQQALNKLNEACRDLLVKFGQGFSYAEIAQGLDVKIGTVMSRMSRCRDSLCNEMGLS